MENKTYNPESAKTNVVSGMWLLLFAELIVFGGIAIAFLGYRIAHQEDFLQASKQLHALIGAFNIVILLTSSLTVALSVVSVKSGKISLAVLFQLSSILMGLFFLVNKYFEWSVNSATGFVPGSVELAKLPVGQNIFCLLYTIMAGAHTALVFFGVLVIAWMTISTVNGNVNKEKSESYQAAGQFWHSLTVVGIFIFSLFYLIG